jgi:hypothetical protein
MVVLDVHEPVAAHAVGLYPRLVEPLAAQRLHRIAPELAHFDGRGNAAPPRLHPSIANARTPIAADDRSGTHS